MRLPRRLPPRLEAECVQLGALLHWVRLTHPLHYVSLRVMDVIGIAANDRRQGGIEDLMKLICLGRNGEL